MRLRLDYGTASLDIVTGSALRGDSLALHHHGRGQKTRSECPASEKKAQLTLQHTCRAQGRARTSALFTVTPIPTGMSCSLAEFFSSVLILFL